MMVNHMHATIVMGRSSESSRRPLPGYDFSVIHTKVVTVSTSERSMRSFIVESSARMSSVRIKRRRSEESIHESMGGVF